MRVVHIVPGVDDVANGMAVVAHLLAKEQGDAAVVDLNHETTFAKATAVKTHKIHENDVEEVWVHGMWLPKEWLACWCALRAGKRLVRMTHGSLSSLYLKHQSPFKKWIVGPIERWCLRRCDRIVATCEAEKAWIEKYLGKKCPAVEVTDLKRFFDLSRVEGERERDEFSRVERVEERGVSCRVERFEGLTQRRRGAECAEDDGKLPSADGRFHLLYLGRRHPLKGVEYLEKAVAELNSNPVNPVNPVLNSSLHASTRSTRLRIVSNAFGEELEKVWDWCDVLVLPTLSENFGLVVAEALERGKRVITTDGAPAWNHEIHETHENGVWSGYSGRLIYLKGYRDGTPEHRIMLLKRAIESLLTPDS